MTIVLPRLVKRLEEESRSELAVFDGIDHIGRVDPFIFRAGNRLTIVVRLVRLEQRRIARPADLARITGFPLAMFFTA